MWKAGMRAALALTVVALLVGCEPAQQPTPKTEPNNEQANKDVGPDHVWRGQGQALDKARAAAEQAGQAPAELREAP